MPKYASEIRRTSLNLDLGIVAEARDILGTDGTTATVRAALEEVIRRDKLRRLAEWRFELTPEGEKEFERWTAMDP
jgi:Bacterial antitoxin of type II TA system, VapB